jgi:hypothetical protein
LLGSRSDGGETRNDQIRKVIRLPTYQHLFDDYCTLQYAKCVDSMFIDRWVKADLGNQKDPNAVDNEDEIIRNIVVRRCLVERLTQ